MNDTLGPEARQLIHRARREEPAADADELARIRRSVLSAASGAAALGSVGKALAVQGATRFGVSSLIKASLLGSGAGAMAFGVSLMLSSPASHGPPSRAQPPAVSGAPSVVLSRSSSAAAEHEPTSGHAAEPSVSDGEPQPSTAARPLHPVKSSDAPLAAGRVAATGSQRAELRAAGAPANSTAEAMAHGASAVAAPAAPQSAASAPAAATLAPELALLEQVQSELRSGHGQRALDLLDGSAIDVEHSQLGAERLAAEVFAACQSGDLARVRRAKARFLREFANSPSVARVRASCARAEGAE